jgi:glucose/arabinose dehydrogenase
MTTATDNRVVRFVPGETPTPILTGIAAASFHNAGRIAFGPDGLLYIGVGDAGTQSDAQDPTKLNGKILRINPDGSVPAGNLSPASPVYALGLRDPQGLAWDDTGRLYATECGPDRDDEVNVIVAGGNYGWPTVTGDANDSRFIDPIVVRQPPVASWSGAAIVRGGVQQWDGDLLVAALRGERLYRFDRASDGTVIGSGEELYVDTYGRLRHVEQAPDGSLWLLTSNRDGRGSPTADDDRIIRIAPPS